jgi:hypothetical protein
MDKGAFVSRAEAESTTLRELLERYLEEVTPLKNLFFRLHERNQIDVFFNSNDMNLLPWITLLIGVIDGIEDVAHHKMENHILERNTLLGLQQAGRNCRKQLTAGPEIREQNR